MSSLGGRAFISGNLMVDGLINGPTSDQGVADNANGFNKWFDDTA